MKSHRLHSEFLISIFVLFSFWFAPCLTLNPNSGDCDDNIPKKAYRKSFINIYPRYKAFNDGGDPGEPLFLTPLIENKTIPREEIRKKAAVPKNLFHNVESYAGYLTVEPKYNSNLFFWYFPAVENASTTPVVVWLQGGPGASSLFGLFAENGPIEIDAQRNAKKREITWSQNHNLIYIDNPVGTGFSFTDDDKGYAKNEKDVGLNLHEAVIQLYELFEWNKDSGFWATGESYGGKYVPALAFHIQHTANARVKIPLKGVAIGNGLSDPLHQLKYGDYLYQLGLIDEHGLEQFHNAELKGVNCIKKRDMDCAFDVFDNLINADVSGSSLFQNLTGFDFYYNYLQSKPDAKFNVIGEFVQKSEIRRAIHVGNKTFHDLDGENKVEEHLKHDVMDTVAPWVAKLLDEYKVCLYNGQMDIIVAYPLTHNYLRHLKFKGDDEFKKAKRLVWRVDGEVAGYVKEAGNLKEIMIRDAGHMAPIEQPKWLFDLITRVTRELPFK